MRVNFNICLLKSLILYFQAPICIREYSVTIIKILVLKKWRLPISFVFQNIYLILVLEIFYNIFNFRDFSLTFLNQ